MGVGLGGIGHHHHMGPGSRRMLQAAPMFGSRPLAADGGYGLREQRLRTMIRMAETKGKSLSFTSLCLPRDLSRACSSFAATLTSLRAAERAAALEESRRLKEELLAEQRMARDIDRAEDRRDHLEAAREAAHNRREIQADMEHERELQRLDMMASRGGGAMAGRPGFRSIGY